MYTLRPGRLSGFVDMTLLALPWIQLTKLELASQTVSSCFKILQETTNLQILTITTLYADRVEPTLSPQLTLPRLHSFILYLLYEPSPPRRLHTARSAMPLHRLSGAIGCSVVSGPQHSIRVATPSHTHLQIIIETTRALPSFCALCHGRASGHRSTALRSSRVLRLFAAEFDIVATEGMPERGRKGGVQNWTDGVATRIV
ncbi:hypothetical protein R3P38DRAFT_2876659 [Favolaschia claudopus]|uniref:Uncharacterized protein n=1 Tax=Favolaschia claudopus TaxID=2862362 RepID=A0AAW0D6Z3_9AGAR